MAPKSKTSLVAARTSFVCAVKGQTLELNQGDLVEANHPVVAKYPDLFEAPRLRYPIVEQATAAPGEKR